MSAVASSVTPEEEAASAAAAAVKAAKVAAVRARKGKAYFYKLRAARACGWLRLYSSDRIATY